MTFITLIVCKALLWALRRLGHTGSALPGLVAEKTNRSFLPSMLAKLPRQVVIVTGTNGKTTTTKLIVELLKAHDLSVLTNQTGSNFERGISSVLIDKASVTGRLNYDIAVFELDEAHAAKFVRRLAPIGLVALNIMRDQMDRFGEIDYTAKLLEEVASRTTGWLVMNANDQRISKLGESQKGKSAIWFGYDKALAKLFISDDQYYNFGADTYFAAHAPSIKLVSDIDKYGRFKVSWHHAVHELSTKLVGSHNAINIAAALATLESILPDAPFERTAAALAKIQPAFGRGELISLENGNSLQLQLIKNPGSFSYALHAIGDNQTKPAAVGIAINDDFADSRDVSWLWDVRFDALKKWPAPICGGSRAYDMAVRLKYDDIPAQAIQPPLEDFLDACLEPAGHAVIFCTYTAMLNLRKRLLKRGQVKKVGL